MLLISNLFLLLVNAVTFRREFTILFNLVAIFILLYSGIIWYGSLSVTCLDNWIGIYNGLFHSTAITHSFDLFIYIIGVIILFFSPESFVNSTDLASILVSGIPARAVTPIVVYSNADTQKFEIIKENKGKSAIYC